MLIRRKRKTGVLSSNASVMNTSQCNRCVDGIEMYLATNYVGPFLFTALPAPKFLTAGAGRVVNIFSNGPAFSPFRFSNYDFSVPKALLPPNEQLFRDACSMFGIPYDTRYVPTVAYGRSKTIAFLHAVVLNARLGRNGVRAVSLHPGTIGTQLW